MILAAGKDALFRIATEVAVAQGLAADAVPRIADTLAASGLAWPSLMTLAQVAGFCQCSTDKVEAWIAAGQLNALNLGDGSRAMLRVTCSDLAVFLESRRMPGQAQPSRVRRRKYVPQEL